VESALSSYRAESANSCMLLDSRMTFLNVERDYYKAVAEHQMELPGWRRQWGHCRREIGKRKLGIRNEEYRIQNSE